MPGTEVTRKAQDTVAIQNRPGVVRGRWPRPRVSPSASSRGTVLHSPDRSAPPSLGSFEIPAPLKEHLGGLFKPPLCLPEYPPARLCGSSHLARPCVPAHARPRFLVSTLGCTHLHKIMSLQESPDKARVTAHSSPCHRPLS